MALSRRISGFVGSPMTGAGSRRGRLWALTVLVGLWAGLTFPAPSSAQVTPGTTWRQQQPAAHPPARDGAAMAYDAARQQTVLFGGVGEAGDETWTWDGTNWTQRRPPKSPPARSRHAMAYDSARQRVVLFGGDGSEPGLNYLDDTWTWDGTTWTQSLSASPPARQDHVMADDAAGQRVVLFGGRLSGGVMANDTWTWDGATWTEGHQLPRPPAAVGPSMAYDAARERVVLFDGQSLPQQTWTWDGTQRNWTKASPSTSPSLRWGAAMAYHAASQTLVLFGGADGVTRHPLNDTWTWDGTNWTMQAPVLSPSPRGGHVMSNDASHRVVLYGGSTRDALLLTRTLDDTWTYPEAFDPGHVVTTTTSTTTTTVPPPSADLSLTNRAQPDPVAVGGDLAYMLTVTNAGPDRAQQVQVIDSLPAEVSFDSATATQGGCTHTAGTVECDLGDVAKDATATVTINVTPTRSGTISNTASVSSATADPDPANNSATSTVTATTTVPPKATVADFDGNGTTDYSVFRPSSGTWFVRGGLTLNYGTEGDIPVPSDYDGDRKSDVAVFRPSNGVWFVRNSTGGETALAYGTSGDIPVPADYDGDGKIDIAVFRPSNGVWFIKYSTGGDAAVGWGTAGDVAVPGDYDGDRKADLAVFRAGTWFIRPASGAADIAVNYGTTGDIPVVGDYDADTKADTAVFRPSNGFWFQRHSFNGAQEAFHFGTSGDIPVPGDYNGDAIADAAVFRRASGVWFVETGASAAWGVATDIPLPLPHAVRSAYFNP